MLCNVEWNNANLGMRRNNDIIKFWCETEFLEILERNNYTISQRLTFLSVYYTSTRIIYFLRTRYILLSDRGLFYTRRKTLEVSLKVSSTQSTIIVGSPLERNTEESAPTRAPVCVRIDASVRAERVRRADFIVHVVWHQCEIWGVGFRRTIKPFQIE